MASSRKDWEARFGQARDDLATARRGLAESQHQLEALAAESENWQIAAPGASRTADNSPISYKLSQDIRRGREDVERAERRLRELQTEASLAGVPAQWQQPPEDETRLVPDS